MRTKRGRTQTLNYFKRIFNVDPTSDDLRAGLDNISAVVDPQGSSITYLTEQLDIYKVQLEEAREQLKAMDAIHKENKTLKSRVAELESQVAKLEAELARRKKYTPKDKRSE
jgi:predicted RNase H-like nuclease (RuvC/YqgF family)